MGKMMTAAVLTAVLVALIGCSHRQGVADTTYERDDVAIFSEAAEGDTMPDGLIRSVRWIPLEAAGQQDLSEISELTATDSMIVICDRRKALIQAYSTSGRFLYEINRKGQGPGDYLEIAAMTVTPSSIYVLDNFASKLLRYSIADGSFAGDSALPFLAWDIEAFDDDDFLFAFIPQQTGASSGAVERTGYAVWRTDGDLKITESYLPLEKDATEPFGTSRYFARAGNDIIFYSPKYGGSYFLFKRGGDPERYGVELTNPVPDGSGKTLDELNGHDWHFMSATPLVANGYAVLDIAQGVSGEQRFAEESTGLVYSNSTSWARNIPVGIVGTTDGGFIGHISDNYDQYRNLVEFGFQRGDPAVDSTLRDGGTALIVYEMARPGNRD